MYVHRKSCANKVQSYLIKCLALVQSDLDSTLTSANTLKVIFFNLSADYMFHIGNSSQWLLIKVLWKTSYININDLLLSQVGWLVILEGVVAGEVGCEECLFLLLSFAHLIVLVIRLPLAVRGCWPGTFFFARIVAMNIQAWLHFILLHILLIIIAIVLSDLTLCVSVEPVTRSGLEFFLNFLIWWALWSIWFVVVIVHINGLFRHWREMRIIGLVKNVWGQLILLHLICVNLSRVGRLRESSLCVPASVRSHCYSWCIAVIPSSIPLCSNIVISVSQHVWLKLLLPSIFSTCGRKIIGCWWTEGWILLVLFVGIGLLWVSPVSNWGHQCSITLLDSSYGILSIELLHFSFIGWCLWHGLGGCLLTECASKILFLLISLSTTIIAPKSILTSITFGKHLSIGCVLLWASEHIALPIIFNSCRNGMMQVTIILF